MALCLPGLLLAQCSNNSQPAKGTVTGVAAPCIGPITSTGYQKLRVTVYLTHGSRLVADETVKGTHTYRFVVASGDYIVATHEGEGSRPVRVTVRSGQTTHADIPSYCM